MDLAALEDLALLNRVDTKFVFDVADLGGVLSELGEGYRLLDIDGHALHRYENQYFDTDDLACYRQHHNSDLPRYKFRYRRYADTDQVFFEVKKKTNQGRTVKRRVLVDEMSTSLCGPARSLVSEIAGERGWDPSLLVPTVRADFFRLAIGRPELGERATIDIGLHLRMGEELSRFDGVAICELKQAAVSRQSPLAGALKRRGVRPHRMTKYCLGVLAARPDVKANDFKPMVRAVVDLAGWPKSNYASQLFEVDLLVWRDLGEMLVRLGLNLIVGILIIVVGYLPRHPDHEWVFTMFVFNIATFFVVYIMNGLDLNVGFGFGLFALFAILRFRTESIPFFEMTHVFALVAVAVVNAISVGALTWAEVIVADVGITATVMLLSSAKVSNRLATQTVRYEKIANIGPDRREELLDDLRTRTGLHVVDVRVLEIDFLSDTAQLKLYHRDGGTSS